MLSLPWPSISLSLENPRVEALGTLFASALEGSWQSFTDVLAQ